MVFLSIGSYFAVGLYYMSFAGITQYAKSDPPVNKRTAPFKKAV